jgi:hypothetical protein
MLSLGSKQVSSDVIDDAGLRQVQIHPQKNQLMVLVFNPLLECVSHAVDEKTLDEVIIRFPRTKKF